MTPSLHRFTGFSFAALLLLLATECATCQTALPLHLSDQIVEKSTLTDINKSDWVFNTTEAIKTNTIVRWGTWHGVQNTQAIWTGGNSWLTGDVALFGNSTVRVQSDWLRVPRLELASVRGVILSPPASFGRWLKLYHEMQSHSGNLDAIWLSNGQRLEGIVRWTTQKTEDELNSLSIEINDRATQLDLSTIDAIVFSPALFGPIPSDPPLTIALKDGTLLTANNATDKISNVQIELVDGIVIESFDASGSFAAGCTLIAGQPADLVQLDRENPAAYRNLSENSLQWELGINQDLRGKPLQYQQGIVNTGLSMHSDSQVAYRWAGEPGSLLIEAVLAPPQVYAKKQLGSVECKILLAKGGELQTAVEFTLNRRSDSPPRKLLEVDVTDAQLIVLLVEHSDYSTYGDEVYWLNPRIATQVTRQ